MSQMKTSFAERIQTESEVLWTCHVKRLIIKTGDDRLRRRKESSGTERGYLPDVPEQVPVQENRLDTIY